MLEEMTKWIVGTPFEKFVKPSTTKQLWVSQLRVQLNAPLCFACIPSSPVRMDDESGWNI